MLRRCCFAAILVATAGAAGAGQPLTPPVPIARRIEGARAELAAVEARKPARSDEQAEAVERLFDLLDEGGQLESDEAKRLADRDVELRQAQAPEGSAAYALALRRSASIAGQHNQFADAMATAQRALAMVESRDPPDAVAQARVRILLGGLLTTQGRFAESIPLLEDAIAVLDAHHVVDVALGAGLKALAFDYAQTEKLERAQATIDRAMRVAATLQGNDSIMAASYTIVASTIPMRRGDTAAAIGLLERAVPILRDANPPVQSTHELALLTLAQAYRISGDCEHAEPLLRRIEEVEGAHPSPAGTRFLASALNTLSLCLIKHGRVAEAAAANERALALYRNMLGDGNPQTLMVESNLANAYEELGRRDEEIAILRHIIEVTDRTRAKGAADLTPARANLGYTYVWLGRYAEAETLFRDYLDHLGPGRDLSERDPRGAMAGLAVCLWAQGRNEEAFVEALATERSRQKLVRTAGADLGEAHAVKLSANAMNGLDWVLAIAARDGRTDHAQAAWRLAVESRGLVSAISARRLAVARAASDPDLAALWNEWKARDEALVKARVEAARDPSAQTSAALDTAEQRFDVAERALARAARASGAALRRAQADPASIPAALPAGTVLVSYVEADASQPHDLNHPADWEQHGRLYAFAVARGRKPELFDLGPRPVVEEAVRQWLDLVVDRNSDAGKRDEAGRRVRSLVWDPVAKAWPQERVFVVPSAALERVPFAALPSRDARFLVESGYAFHLLDHERDALTDEKKPDDTATLSLIGAPDFSVAATDAAGKRGICAGLRGATFTALPQAEREIAGLRTLWSRREDAVAPIVLQGADATEARTRQVLHGSRIIHFATHGIFLGDRCNSSGPDTRSVEIDDSTTLARGAQELSALVLSGANRPATDTEDDGLLTSEEIAGLDLSGTDWAVLSACDTGVGEHVGGEGVFGLRRAFRLAGARSVVMSLWPVSDSSSADWMLALYRARLQERASTIDSVRAADLTLIRQRREMKLDPAPYYWAAFVATGDWR